MPSSVIRAFTYHLEGRRLDVTFVTGRRYAYADVPAEIVDQLRVAPSKGEFFNAAIRDIYDYERLR
jgi:hypothetical protein